MKIPKALRPASKAILEMRAFGYPALSWSDLYPCSPVDNGHRDGLLPKGWTDASAGRPLHPGADLNFNPPGHFNSDANMPVYAVLAGKVIFARKVPRPSTWGGLIVIQHKWGEWDICTRYAHVNPDSIAVKAGDIVPTGMQIARIGEYVSKDGSERNNHLHFDIGKRDWMVSNPLGWDVSSVSGIRRDYLIPKLLYPQGKP